MNHKTLIWSTLLMVSVGLGSACSGWSAHGASDEDVAEEQGPKRRTATISDVHERRRPAIRECFDEAAEASPQQPVAVEVELHLPRSGSPASIRLLEPESVPEAMRVCLQHVLTGLEYGEARDGGTYYQWITYEAQADALVFSQPKDAYHRWGLTGEEIEAVVAEHELEIDTCYERATQDQPSGQSGQDRKPGKNKAPRGRVLLTLAIGSDGEVARAGIKKSTLGAPAIEGCLIQTVLEMKFPEPRGGGVVVFDLPFRFRPGAAWITD